MSAVPFLPQPGEPSEPRDTPGCAVLAMPDEIDFCNAGGLLPLIMAVVEQRRDALRLLVLDLSATRFMDSQGVHLLAAVRRGLPGTARLRVVAVPGGAPSRVLELSGLRRDVPVHEDLAEALGAANGTAGDGTAGSGTAGGGAGGERHGGLG
ncbi:STAS domain-containing protein [Streptomyces sp. NPDC048187]|uniref:STAS domain-containing protein n=1 Tax=Streptomyces sp. NPDC048187 TaxID=3365509 RepID=UPI0037166FD9